MPAFDHLHHMHSFTNTQRRVFPGSCGAGSGCFPQTRVLGGERAVSQVQSLGSSGVMDRLCERKRYHLFDCGTVSDLC